MRARREGLWAAVLVACLSCGPALAEEMTLSLARLDFDRATETCRVSFRLQSLSGDLPPGFQVEYRSLHFGETVQQCTVIQMTERDPEWTCSHNDLATCDEIAVVRVTAFSCLNNLRAKTACGPISVDAAGLLEDGRKQED